MVTGIYAWCKYVMPQLQDWQGQPIGEDKKKERSAQEVRWQRVEMAPRKGVTEKASQSDSSQVPLSYTVPLAQSAGSVSSFAKQVLAFSFFVCYN